MSKHTVVYAVDPDGQNATQFIDLAPPEGWTVIDEMPATPVIIPQVVSAFQAQEAMARAGLLEDVEALIAAQDGTTRRAWALATEFRRDSPTIAALAGTLGLSDAEVDDLFLAASQITA